MSLLLYCVALVTAPGETVAGVEGSEVQTATIAGLRWYFSPAHIATGAAPPVIDAARAFHAVLQDVFSRSPILPFRFPTTVEDRAALEKLATERAGDFHDFLADKGDKAQIDVRLSLDGLSGDSHEEAKSGRDYLEQRAGRRGVLVRAAQTCREAAMTADFKLFERGENFRCALLFPRAEVVSWLARMRALELPEGVRAVVSGPWPPTAFWEDVTR